jgi:hypothetical protein
MMRNGNAGSCGAAGSYGRRDIGLSAPLARRRAHACVRMRRRGAGSVVAPGYAMTVRGEAPDRTPAFTGPEGKNLRCCPERRRSCRQPAGTVPSTVAARHATTGLRVRRPCTQRGARRWPGADIRTRGRHATAGAQDRGKTVDTRAT